MIVALACTFYLLFAPWYIDSLIVHIIIVFTLLGLALISVILEYCFSIYKLVPIDLYETGMKVVVEDPVLLQEIAQRKREQEEMERKLR